MHGGHLCDSLLGYTNRVHRCDAWVKKGKENQCRADASALAGTRTGGFVLTLRDAAGKGGRRPTPLSHLAWLRIGGAKPIALSDSQLTTGESSC